MNTLILFVILGFFALLALVFVVAMIVLAIFLSRRRDREVQPGVKAGSVAPSSRKSGHVPAHSPAAPVAGAGHCPECGAVLPAGSPEGLCPRCLLQGGLKSSGPATARHSGPATALPPADLATHFPQLEILELLGQGGMGAVYKARQTRLDRLVALKVLPPEAGKDPAFVERFSREARALARLSHPHIVAVHDFGEAGGLYYFLMEFVDGVNLRQLLEAGPLQPAQALQIIPQVCEALHYAHGEGVVHRDIKPENILVDRSGRVKIADFGLAKLLGRGPGEFTLTSSRQVMGTLHYMAPEQMERPLEVDHRADIYSLGVVFYEMLTHELPLGRFAPPSEKAPVDARLDDVVLRALEKEPERRYQHASEVKTDVEAIVTGPTRERMAPVVVAEGPAPARTERVMHRPKKSGGSAWIFLLVLALVLPLFCIPLVVVGGGVLAWKTRTLQRRDHEPFPEDGRPVEQPVLRGEGGMKAPPELPMQGRSGDPSFIEWAAQGDVEAIGRMLAEGTDIGYKDKDGTTPLMAAARNGHLQVVQMLLDRGADPNARDKDGKTALDYALQNKHDMAVEVLRAHRGR
jgi:predicted Ser/Thr protein kinase